MNGTSGFQARWSSTSPSPSSRFLHEQRHQFGTGAWHLLRTPPSQANLTGLFTLPTRRRLKLYIIASLAISSLFGTAVNTVALAQQVTLQGLEITQGVQSLSASNSALNNGVFLVKGKTTLARAFIQSWAPPCPLIRGELNASTPLISSIPIQSISVLDLYVAGGTDLVAKRGYNSGSLNFLMPPSVLESSSVTFNLLILRCVNSTPIVCNNCAAPSPHLPLSRALNHSPKLKIKLVGIHYEKEGFSYPQPSATDYARIKSWISRVYPVVEGTNQLEYSTSTTPADLDTLYPIPDSTPHQAYKETSCLTTNGIFLDAYRNVDLTDPDKLPDNHPLRFTHYVGLVSDGGNPYFYMQGCPEYVVPSTEQDKFSVLASAAVGPNGSHQSPPWYSPSEGAYWDTDGSYGDWYTGHELSHLLGLPHANKKDPSSDTCSTPDDYNSLNIDYPYAYGQLSDSDSLYAGFDFTDNNPHIGTLWHDLMTYCVRQWISSYSYLHIYCRLKEENGGSCPPDLSPPPPSDVVPPSAPTNLKVSELEDNSVVPHLSSPVDISPMAIKVSHTSTHTESRTSSATKSSYKYLKIHAIVNVKKGTGRIVIITPRLETRPEIAGTDSGAQIRIRDRSGNIVASYPLTLMPEKSSYPQADKNQQVSIAIPYAPETGVVELLVGTHVVDMRQASLHPPTLENIRLSRVGNKLAIAWDTSDEDSNKLIYDVRISPDKGKSWETVAVLLSHPKLSVPIEQIQNYSTITVYVVASDEFNTTALKSSPLLLP